MSRVILALVLGGIALPMEAAAQDPFEIVVYGYETTPRSAWEMEGHFNYVATGTTSPEGTVAPTRHQAHVALELTRGVTSHWEVGVYALGAYRPDNGLEYGGWRLRSRVRLPEAWRLPMDVTLGAELEFTRAPYDENAAGLEIRPTFGRRLGRLQFDLNPVIERGLRGRSGMPAEDWEFEPSARVGVVLSKVVGLSVEYHGKTSLFDGAVPAGEHVHQFYPSVDLKLGDDFIIDLGVGFGITSAGDRLILKSRLEVPLGG